MQRFIQVTCDGGAGTIHPHEDGDVCLYRDVEQLVQRIKELESLANDLWPVVNRRRGNLIDLSIKVGLTSEMWQEFYRLQSVADRFLDLMSPPDLGVMESIKAKSGQHVE